LLESLVLVGFPCSIVYVLSRVCMYCKSWTVSAYFLLRFVRVSDVNKNIEILINLLEIKKLDNQLVRHKNVNVIKTCNMSFDIINVRYLFYLGNLMLQSISKEVKIVNTVKLVFATTINFMWVCDNIKMVSTYVSFTYLRSKQMNLVMNCWNFMITLHFLLKEGLCLNEMS
jgi:hypothetical protein